MRKKFNLRIVKCPDESLLKYLVRFIKNIRLQFMKLKGRNDE